MARRADTGEPTLAEAWEVLGTRLGLAVEQRGDRSIRAQGQVRGRSVTVEIDGAKARSEFGRFFFGLNTISSRNRREKWHTLLRVECANPRGVTGTIESAVDTDDPAWDPRNFDPRNGRKIRTDPSDLREQALSVESYERLMSIIDDVRIEVQPSAIVLDQVSTAIPGSGANYVAGSTIHHFQGSPPPWPDRALIGPPWWIDLFCDIAESLDG